MIRLARGWLGGPLAFGTVSAFGNCNAGASALAAAAVQTNGQGESLASAQVQAQALRIAEPVVSCGSGAAAQAASVVEFAGFGASQGQSGAVGGSHLDANGSAHAVPAAALVVTPRKTRRAQARPRATATGVAEAEVYVLVTPSPSRGSARCEATNGYFAWGSATTSSGATAAGQIITPTAGDAAPGCSVAVAARFDGEALGAIQGRATAMLDPFIQRGTVKLFDGNIHAVGQAGLAAEPYVYSAALAVATATGQASTNIMRAFRVEATPAAAVIADAQVIYPFGGSVTVGAQAECRAASRLAANGLTYPGSAETTATATPARAAAGFPAPAHAAADITGGHAQISVPLAPVSAGVAPIIRATRRKPASARAQASAMGRAANQINDLSQAPIWRTTSLGGHAAEVIVPAADRTVTQLGATRSMAA